ncbi:MAG: hypothetical protein D6712_19670 [Chloroflexi bacterium]|nr:MAG: hypothetical protein D6712_19670 [Chloroflexota bacterium]
MDTIRIAYYDGFLDPTPKVWGAEIETVFVLGEYRWAVSVLAEDGQTPVVSISCTTRGCADTLTPAEGEGTSRATRPAPPQLTIEGVSVPLEWANHINGAAHYIYFDVPVPVGDHARLEWAGVEALEKAHAAIIAAVRE